MTKVFRLFEEEKQEAVNKAAKKTKNEIAFKLIELGLDMAEIMKVTGLTREEINVLREGVLQEQ